MKYFLIFISLLAIHLASISQTSFKAGNIDTLKSMILIDMINNVIKDKNSSTFKFLYLNIDLRSKKILSDGMSYTPITQDTALTNDTILANFIKSGISKRNLKTHFIFLPEIGKINRTSLLQNILNFYEESNIESKSCFYIEISQPIDGWDVIEILFNNYWRQRYGKDDDGQLKSTVYLPLTYAYTNIITNKPLVKHYLVSYSVNCKDGNLKCEFLSRAELKIE